MWGISFLIKLFADEEGGGDHRCTVHYWMYFSTAWENIQLNIIHLGTRLLVMGGTAFPWGQRIAAYLVCVLSEA